MRIILPPYLGKTFIGRQELKNLSAVIKSKNLFRYHQKKTVCSRVEKKLSKKFSTKNFLLLVNATAALKTALLSLRPAPGNFVIIPALSYIATANACLNAGLVPVCLDVDDSGHLSPDALRRYLSQFPAPLAVIVVHLDGAGAKVHEIKALCDEKKIPLIEDVAQSFGVQRKGSNLGTIGDIGCFSFQENKILSTGEGGAITTRHDTLFNNICAYCDHGASRGKSIYQAFDMSLGYGENYKTTELMAAVLEVQLSHFSRLVDRQKKHYKQLVSLGLPIVEREEEDIPLSLWIENRGIRDRLECGTISYYNWEYLYLPEHPILKQKRSVYANGFPWNLTVVPECSTLNAERISRERISVPVYPQHHCNQKHLQSLCTLMK